MTPTHCEHEMGQTLKRPLVSVVMSALNEEQNIALAVDSILRQTYRNLELLVVDDYSTDKTAEILRSYQDSRLRVITKTIEESGAAASRNLAISLASGAYIAYQDADDTSCSTRIERELSVALEKPGHVAVGCWMEQSLAEVSTILQFPSDHDSIVAGFTRLTRRCTFASATLLWPLTIARAFPQRPMFRYMEDWDLLCRVAEANVVEFYNVPAPLYRYILRPKGVKMQRGWAEYNVFQRACQERRRLASREWESFEEFKRYLETSSIDRLRWGLLRKALESKAHLEMRTLRHASESPKRSVLSRLGFR
jgi:glycosyltransferase involved in cell wall biosynthesis